jgi:hypothetical protein
MKTFLLSASVFVVLALFSREATAQVTTILEINNNTASTLAIPGYIWNGGAGDETWLTSCPAGNGWCPAAGDGTWSAGPPTTIGPFSTVYFGASSSGLFSGTGATVNYSIVAAPNPTTLAFYWSNPWATQQPVGGCGVGACASASELLTMTVQLPNFGGTSTSTGTTEGNFSALSPDGEPAVSIFPYVDGFVAWQLNDPAPQVSTAEAMSGYAGDSIVVLGANFSTLGATQVFFDSALSPSVTCATSTECTAVVPTALAIPNITSQVTVDVLGESTPVGTFTYLPAGPGCAYSTGGGNTEGDNFEVECTPDALGDAIWVFELDSAGVWEYVYNYPVASGVAFQAFLLNVGGGTTGTFVGCFSINGQFPNPGTSSTSTPQGCDSPTTLTAPKHHESGDG